MVSDERRAEVEHFLGAVADWAPRREDLEAAALVGSWARDDARQDSDVDLILFTEIPAAYTEHGDWISELALEAALVATRDWGDVTERRLRLPSGLEVEVGIARPSWASTEPVDPGTQRVVRDGFRALYDPHGLLAALGPSEMRH